MFYVITVPDIKKVMLGARCSSMVRSFAHGAMGCLMVNPLSYFSFQPVLHDYVLSCVWDGEYKRTLAANQKE